MLSEEPISDDDHHVWSMYDPERARANGSTIIAV